MSVLGPTQGRPCSRLLLKVSLNKCPVLLPASKAKVKCCLPKEECETVRSSWSRTLLSTSSKKIRLCQKLSTPESIKYATLLDSILFVDLYCDITGWKNVS